MTIPETLLLSKRHAWVRWIAADQVRIGLSHVTQEQMGSLVFVNLPEVGDVLTAGETMGDIESETVVFELSSPVSGIVSRVNDRLFDAPEQIKQDPYGAWLIEVSDISKKEELLSTAEYEAYCLQKG